MNRLVPLAAAAMVGLGLAGGGLPPGQGVARSDGSRMDLATSAVAVAERPDVVDDAVSSTAGGRGPGVVDTAASANAGCDGCSATATALHIAYLNRPTDADLDNVTVAWSQCRACSATAVSVQVVILHAPTTVRANNRALAVNAACEDCRSASAAFQLVMVGGHHDRLTTTDVEELHRWIADQVAALKAAASTGGSAAPAAAEEAGLDQLQALVDEGLGGATTLRRDSDIRTGPTSEPSPEQGPPAAA